MNLSQLKKLKTEELINIAKEEGVRNTELMNKKDLIFDILKRRALKNKLDAHPRGVDQFFQPTPTEELVDRVLGLCQIQKELVETMDTYIPEPLRNADGTPIYVHATGHCVVRATDSASSAGMFAQKPANQQDLSSIDSLIYDDSSLSNYDAGSKK